MAGDRHLSTLLCGAYKRLCGSFEGGLREFRRALTMCLAEQRDNVGYMYECAVQL